MTDKICKRCGLPIENPHHNQQNHLECANIAYRQYQAAYQRALRQKKEQKPKFCLTCGKDLSEYGKTARKRCPECSKKRDKERKTIDNQKFTSYRKAITPKPKPVKTKKRKTPIPHCWDMDCKSALQIDIEARALGLSYGKYRSLIDTLMIEPYLNEQNIYDGLDRIEKAWKAFQKEQARREEVDRIARENSVEEMRTT